MYGARMLTSIVSPPLYDGLVELHLQFGVAIERAREIRLAGDAVAERVQLRAGRRRAGPARSRRARRWAAANDAAAGGDA